MPLQQSLGTTDLKLQSRRFEGDSADVLEVSRGIGVGTRTRDLAPLPQYIQELLLVRDRAGRPHEDHWQCTTSECAAVVHCWEISFGKLQIRGKRSSV